MAYDYSDDIAGAAEDIAEYGRPVTFILLQNTASDPDNPLADTSIPPIEVSTFAAFVYPQGTQNLGRSTVDVNRFKEAEQICLVAPDGINDLTQFHFIRDEDGSEWAISGTQALKPGAVDVLYYIGVKRP
jgi:hypothetical protein